jgi:hypothetical protein
MSIIRHLSIGWSVWMHVSYGRQRVYRNGIAALIGALIFIVAGVAVHYMTLSKILKGEPIMVNKRRSGGGPGRPATAFETFMFAAILPTAAWGIGLGALLFWKNYRVVTTDDRIRVNNWLGKHVVDTRWDEIVSLKYRTSRRGRWYVLDNGDRKTTIHLSIPNWQSLDREIQERAGHRIVGPKFPQKWS